MSADHSAPHTSLRDLHAQLAADTPDAELLRRIRALVDELMHGWIAAMLDGSPAEIAELMGALRRRPPAPAATRSALATRGVEARPGRKISRTKAPAPAEERSPASDRAADRRPTLGPSSPFDITSPGELLASTEVSRPSFALAASRGSEARPPVDGTASTADESSSSNGKVEAPARASHGRAAHLLDTPAAPNATPNATRLARSAAGGASSAETDQEAESERRPKIVLREGERLLSATGSGVVIRRARLHNR